ncbi:MAG TPA: phosphodiesterase [Alphaproteobacteria bacterium]|nr:phosphodiesterase [Alphaproteobacteria bacterium]
MRIAQISDFHIRPAGELIYGALDTAAYLARAVATLNALDPQPDLALLTGDLVDGGSDEEYARLRALLAPLRAPYRVIPGNHDTRDGLRRAFAADRYLPTSGDFLHYAIEDGAVRILALDSLVPGKVWGRLCRERLAWLEAKLAAAPERPTMIVVHHPPFLTGIAHMDAHAFEGAAQFAAIVRRHDQVERVIAGHVHRAMQVRWAGTVASTCPSTAHQFALDLRPRQPAMWTDEPPGYQIHVWLAAAGLVTHTGAIGDHSPQPLRD